MQWHADLIRDLSERLLEMVAFGARLLEHVGLYGLFMFQYALSPEAAFDMECDLFHAHRPTHNQTHPRAPMGSQRACPGCLRKVPTEGPGS